MCYVLNIFLKSLYFQIFVVSIVIDWLEKSSNYAKTKSGYFDNSTSSLVCLYLTLPSICCNLLRVVSAGKAPITSQYLVTTQMSRLLMRGNLAHLLVGFFCT